MKQKWLLVFCLLQVFVVSAQKKMQPLQATRLAIFKNGTCFVKREGIVSVVDKSFYMPAPEQVLMGTYWLSAGKEAAIRSAVIKIDTFRVQRNITDIKDHLRLAIGKTVILYRNVESASLQTLSGVLQAYNEKGDLVTLLNAQGQTVVAKASSFEQVAITGITGSTFMGDTAAIYTKVNLDKDVNSIKAATVSLETGIEWYPSYLVRIINDKEARLEMKATIVNNSSTYMNTSVDIIIGSPEMFYGKQLDPACISYLATDLLTVDNNKFNFTSMQANMLNSTPYLYNGGQPAGKASEDDAAGDKEGEKFEDLFYYRLGNLDLERGARVLVPVLSTTVEYKDVYTADLGINSTEADENQPLEVYHGYRLLNTTSAPFTTGSALVLNKEEQPLAQTRIAYTPVKGVTEVRLSKAIDMSIKNDETEQHREKVNEAYRVNNTLERIFYNGQIKLINYKDKPVTIRVRKTVEGAVQKQSDGGTAKKLKENYRDSNTIMLMEWEITIAAGATKVLNYNYNAVK